MKRHLGWIVVFLSLVTTMTTLYSYQYRKDMFNTLWHGHEWLTASTVVFARNWYDQGPLSLGFLQLWNPRSVEFQDVVSRQPYVSAPPGTIIPIYLLSLLVGMEPSVLIVHSYNVGLQGCTALAMAIAVCVVLRRNGFSTLTALASSIAGILFFMLFAVNMYGFQNIFYSDQAVVLPFALFVMLEAIRKDDASLLVRSFQAGVLFWGCYTDWFMWCAALVMYMKRVLFGEIPLAFREWLADSVAYWAAPGLALMLFLIQMCSYGLISSFVARVMMHGALATGAETPMSYFLATWWGQHVSRFYGTFSPYLFISAFFLALTLMTLVVLRRVMRRSVDQTLLDATGMLWIAIVPPLVYTHLLRNYALPHDFSTHKLSITLVLLSCGALPLLGAYLVRLAVRLAWRGKPGTPKFLQDCATNAGILLPVLIALLIMHCFPQQMWRYRLTFLGGRDSDPFKELGEFIRSSTTTDDLVVSPTVEIASRPPQWLAYSNKRVYLCPTLFDIFSKAYSCGGRVRELNILIDSKAAEATMEYQVLLSKSRVHSHKGQYTMYKVPLSDLRQLVSETYPLWVRHLMRLHKAINQTNDGRTAYAADFLYLRATNFLCGSYGILNRGQNIRGERTHLWGFNCEKSLLANAPPSGKGWIRIPVKRNYETFRTVVGLSSQYGNVVFSIDVDGREVFSSGVFGGRDLPVFVEIDVRSSREVVLWLSSNGTSANDEAVWIDPQFTSH